MTIPLDLEYSNKYTKKEMRLLAEMLTDYREVRHIKTSAKLKDEIQILSVDACIEKFYSRKWKSYNGLHTRTFANSNRTVYYDNLPEYFRLRWPRPYSILYKKKLKKVPLMINHVTGFHLVFCKFRLTIGK